MNKGELISELWNWANSSKGLENLWGDGLLEDIESFVADGMTYEQVKQELLILDKMEEI